MTRHCFSVSSSCRDVYKRQGKALGNGADEGRFIVLRLGSLRCVFIFGCQRGGKINKRLTLVVQVVQGAEAEIGLAHLLAAGIDDCRGEASLHGQGEKGSV